MASDYTASNLKGDVQNAGSADQGMGSTGSSPTSGSSDMSGAVSDAKRAAGEMMDTARQRGAEVAENVRSEAQRLYREGERRVGDLTHQAEDYYDEVSDMVRRQPAAALGIAAGVGFLIGLILARR